MKTLFAVLLLLCPMLSQAESSGELSTLYRIQTFRAAPGALLEFIEINQALESEGLYSGWSERAPFMARHSQGDQWDIMLIHPMINYEFYYAADKLTLKKEAQRKFATQLARLEEITSFREDLFAVGPGLETLTREFRDKNFLHIEIFFALAGRKAELLSQRRMENDYLKLIGQRPNEIFTVDGGGDADVITIGFYDSLQEFARPSKLSSEQRNELAIQAGFKGNDDISPYLRTLIASHHDTLANVVR
jgi:hypothetical protein